MTKYKKKCYFCTYASGHREWEAEDGEVCTVCGRVKGIWAWKVEMRYYDTRLRQAKESYRYCKKSAETCRKQKPPKGEIYTKDALKQIAELRKKVK